MKEKIKELNEKYKNYLSYPILNYRHRKWSDSGPGTGRGKGIKYEATYHANIKNYDGVLGLDIFAFSLEELEEKLNNAIKEKYRKENKQWII